MCWRAASAAPKRRAANRWLSDCGRDGGEAVEGERDDEVTSDAGGQLECVVGVAIGSVELTLCDRHA